MTFDECTAAIRAKVGGDSGLNATLKFDCGEACTIFVDDQSLPSAVDNRSGDADCTVGITLNHLAAMLRGEIEPAAGFMPGKLKVQGDTGVALRMQRVV
ncbi:SCP2 sterol-binding domain-containing protein [uncultured Piscinibacter sp.]|uniref:SCP2 sterol-binding domain-containing protein n=1 Tax=uncultured Piscinibacter sp. TaxID=1131835 RepID=UPI0026326C25|nr:SCP2 sterol-binding domain-containing protein [uncultured Piscinibacter sp.]